MRVCSGSSDVYHQSFESTTTGEAGGLYFRPSTGNTIACSASIAAVVTGCIAPGLKTTNETAHNQTGEGVGTMAIQTRFVAFVHWTATGSKRVRHFLKPILLSAIFIWSCNATTSDIRKHPPVFAYDGRQALTVVSFNIRVGYGTGDRFAGRRFEGRIQYALRQAHQAGSGGRG